MTDLPDWAKDKADKYLSENAEDFGYYGRESTTGAHTCASLAALLVEVRERAKKEREALVLAEVRRVVEEMLASKSGRILDCHDTGDALDAGYIDACDEILARLEKL